MKKPIDKLKCGKALDVDGITVEMLNHRRKTVVEWMFVMCNHAWKQKYQMSGKK